MYILKLLIMISLTMSLAYAQNKKTKTNGSIYLGLGMAKVNIEGGDDYTHDGVNYADKFQSVNGGTLELGATTQFSKKYNLYYDLGFQFISKNEKLGKGNCVNSNGFQVNCNLSAETNIMQINTSVSKRFDLFSNLSIFTNLGVGVHEVSRQLYLKASGYKDKKVKTESKRGVVPQIEFITLIAKNHSLAYKQTLSKMKDAIGGSGHVSYLTYRYYFNF